MSKRDTVKIAKYSLWAHEWSADSMPHKSTKKARVKERQAGKKVIRKERKELGK